ncbi:hypothetical protein GCM10027578_43460 [Spirosoma luteolum]
MFRHAPTVAPDNPLASRQNALPPAKAGCCRLPVFTARQPDVRARPVVVETGLARASGVVLVA